MTTGTGPDAVVLAPSLQKVFVANSGSTLTAFSTTTCNQSTTSGCSSPTQVASGGHLSSPSALAVSGSTLYVGNTNGSVAVYNVSGSTPTWVATVSLLSGSVPTALAVDATNGFVYVADGTNNRVEYFSATTCNATTTTGCSATPSTVSVGKDPVALVVASGAGDLYVANAGTGGGISVVSLSTHAVVRPFDLDEPALSNGTGVVQSIGLSPDTNEVLAVLKGLGFPGDVMATINTSSQSITSTVNLETGTDSMGQLVSDGTLRLRLGHRRDEWRRRHPEPEPRRLGPGQPALRHGGRGHLVRSRDPHAGPAAGRAGVERPALLLRGRRRRRDLADVQHAVLPAGTGHGHRQHRDDLRRVERRLP